MSHAILRPPTAFAAKPEPKGDRDPRYLAWLRQQPCLTTSAYGREVEAHHVRLARAAGGGFIGAGKLGKRVCDYQCVPLHAREHISLHTGSERQWWEDRQIDPLTAAAVFVELYDQGVRGTITPEQFASVRRLSAIREDL